MKQLILSIVLLLFVGVVARAQEAAVRLVFHQDGLVTLTANNALMSEVLSEWERVGGTTVKGLDRLPADRITLNLAGVHERTALDAVFRTYGYVTTLRVDVPAGQSLLKAIVVVPRSAGAPAYVPPPVDMSMPESRYAYPPPTENETEHARALMESVIPPSARPKVENQLMPEMRYQYMDPVPLEPPTEPAPEPEPKPEPKTKKPPSGR